ncbi:ABC transporter permease [Ancylobacter terrae]|uniref:ABC transporter permease n=1 Tax=Ancylobacter sp. sgz301288 TaxID=3342077 RepID=UPI00385EB041
MAEGDTEVSMDTGAIARALPVEPGGRPRLPAGLGAAAIQYALALVTLLVVVGPIVPILYQAVIDRPIYDAGGLLTLGNFGRLFGHEAFAGVVYNSLVFSFFSTLISQGLGAVLAILIGRTNVPGARVFGSLVLWPIFISGLVFTFGWFVAYGPTGYLTMYVKLAVGIEPWNLYSLTGMAIISGISSVPITVLFCLSSSALADTSLEDAARVCGARPLRILRTVTLPMLAPAIAYSGILNFLNALETLSIPLLLGEPAGIRMFMSFIYAEGIERPKPDYGLVGAATVVLLVIVGLLILLQERLLGNTRRFVTVGGKAGLRRQFDLGTSRWPAFALLALYAGFGIVMPMMFVFLRGFVSFISPLVPFWQVLTLENFAQALTLPGNIRALWNTLLLSVVGGAVATLGYALVTIVVHRSQFRFRGILKLVALLPRGVPGMIAGLGVFYALLAIPAIQHLAGTIWIIGLAYLARYIPTGYGAMSPALLQIGPDLDRSARVMGASWWQSCRAVILPLLRPAMLASYCLLFIAFLKEYATAVFLFAPGTEVLGTAMLRYWANGDIGPMAALSAIQIAITLVFLALAHRIPGVSLVR